VIKVIWGGRWDPLLERDKDGLLQRLMEECVDGEYQSFKANDGAFVREHFFGKYPELKEMVANMSDEEIWRLNRGGHDANKVYSAYHRAMHGADGRPTVILAKTVKGFGMGKAGEGVMGTHQKKKLDVEGIKHIRDRFNIPIPDDQIESIPLYRPADDAPEMEYLKQRRAALGGSLPQRKTSARALAVPALDAFKALLEDSGKREFSTTMAFVRMLQTLVRDKTLKDHVVPIVPDEARTFGMEGMFRQLGIYSIHGQLYEPQDHDQLAFYKEDTKGQILEEGINEAGAMSSWIAAATSYASNGTPMIPFYIFYSMFGFQRIGDLAWAAGDMRARGFLIGGTAGRTTLNGEGLQHEDGHSQILASTVPNCRPYDPTFAYELAVIVQDGLRRMLTDQQDCYFYITCMNENYQHPAMPAGVEEGIVKGLYRFSQSEMSKPHARVQLLGSGTILREVIAAAAVLEAEYDIAADVWSAPSFTLLKRDGQAVDRWNRLNPEAEPHESWVSQSFSDAEGPFLAATDYMKSYSDQIRAWVPGAYTVLGTDGFGRSDSRANLRAHFEVDCAAVVVAALKALADQGSVDAQVVARAVETYGLDPSRPDPVEL
jgi:pyruvate dehydrogenase E1 component